MLQEEKMEEKRKKDKEEIQKRFADVERPQAEEREAERGALSRSLSFNIRISYSLRHVRSSSNMMLACSMHMPVQLFFNLNV